MKNIRIEAKSPTYMVVIADSDRFGKNEVMFEGNTFDQCFEYVKRETGKEKLQLQACILDGCYVDREGRCFPAFMNVVG